MKKKLIAAPYLLWMVLFIIAPLLFVAYYAFTDSSGAFSFNNVLSLGQYAEVFADSIYFAMIASMISLLISYPVAYCIAHAKPTHQKLLIMLVILPMCMSFLLRTLAWVSLLEDNGFINKFIMMLGFEPLKLIRTNGAVILGMVYNYIPYMILPLYTVLIKIDNSLYEASADLGANKLQTFFRVTLKMSVPGIISGITMVFVPAVSTFYISKKLGSTSSIMVGDVVESLFKTSYNPNLGAAMSLVLMVIILICMALVNRFGEDDGEAIVV